MMPVTDTKWTLLLTAHGIVRERWTLQPGEPGFAASLKALLREVETAIVCQTRLDMEAAR